MLTMYLVLSLNELESSLYLANKRLSTWPVNSMGRGIFTRNYHVQEKIKEGVKLIKLYCEISYIFVQYRDYFLQPTGWNFKVMNLWVMRDRNLKFGCLISHYLWFSWISILYYMICPVRFWFFYLKKCHFWILIFWISLKFPRDRHE